METKQLTFGSLFAGIGGLDLGFERAGMQCKWQVEIDDYANKVLAKHWPDVLRYRDVREFPPEPIEKHKVDIIAGGFPCQDISYAGKGAGLEGKRSGLFYEVVRIIRVLGPRYVVLENVAALLTRGIPEVLGSLASVGYDAEWHCIPAAAVGAPHIRDRVFILAYLSDRRVEQRRINTGMLSDGRQPTASTRYDGTKRQSIQILSKCRQKSKESWASESGVGRVVDGVPARVDRLRCLGNAVVPQVAEFIGKQIVEFDKENQPT